MRGLLTPGHWLVYSSPRVATTRSETRWGEREGDERVWMQQRVPAFMPPRVHPKAQQPRPPRLRSTPWKGTGGDGYPFGPREASFHLLPTGRQSPLPSVLFRPRGGAVAVAPTTERGQGTVRNVKEEGKEKSYTKEKKVNINKHKYSLRTGGRSIAVREDETRRRGRRTIH